MFMPISSIAIMARGLTRVASVPAENALKQSPDKCLSSPSAIWLLAELWVHRNRTLLFFCGASAAATGHAPLFGAGEQAIGGLAEQRRGDLTLLRIMRVPRFSCVAGENRGQTAVANCARKLLKCATTVLAEMNKYSSHK